MISDPDGTAHVLKKEDWNQIDVRMYMLEFRRDDQASGLVRAPTTSVAYQGRDRPHPLRLQGSHYRRVVHSQVLN